MYCSNCGNTLAEDSRFCGECGTPVTLEGGADPVQTEGGAAAASQSVAQHEYVVKGKALSKSYFQVFMNQLKAPFFEAREMKEDKMTYGMISILLFSLFISLTSYLNIQQASGGFINVPFFSTVVGMFAGWAIMFFLVTLVLFVTFKIMRTEAGYGNLMNRLGSLLSLPLLLVAAAFVTGLVQISLLSTLLLSIGTSAATLSVFSVIFSVERSHDKAMDPFYGTIIAGIGTVIVVFIVFVSILGSLFHQLQFLFY